MDIWTNQDKCGLVHITGLITTAQMLCPTVAGSMTRQNEQKSCLKCLDQVLVNHVECKLCIHVVLNFYTILNNSLMTHYSLMT